MLKIIQNIGRKGALCKCRRCLKSYEIPDRYSAKKSRVGHLCMQCKTCVSNMGEITQDKLKEVFSYDPETGEIVYKVDTLRNSVGDIATYHHTGGYENICINTENLLAHRIIFLYMEGYLPDFVDHINHNRKDNRWVNLRAASRLENNVNTSLSKNSATSVNGVSIHKPTNKFRAYINKNYKQIHLGLFDTLEEAIAARDLANKEHNYHENHGK